jgi:hypothetical protein
MRQTQCLCAGRRFDGAVAGALQDAAFRLPGRRVDIDVQDRIVRPFMMNPRLSVLS